MDIDKCVLLHNKIAEIHAASSYLHPDCQLRRNFFSVYGDAAASLRSRLRGDLSLFLERTDYFTCETASETTAWDGDIGDGDSDTSRAADSCLSRIRPQAG